MTKIYSILALAFFLPLGSALASDESSVYEGWNKTDGTAPLISAESWQTTMTRNQSNAQLRNKPHSVGKRMNNVAALRSEAIRTSMKYLPRLRPYASNYPRMVSAVRAYWRTNTTNPNAARLTNMIMQHVQAKYRFFVRPKLRSGIARGINLLKRKLRKS